ncbi:MAG: beta-ketoacyl-ACP synthase II [Ignavibacteriales bacterium]|nr:beta-ketoacyl-ACP synthase II [Ignavibacteriales bacterium]
MRHVVVTGIGLVTPLGLSTEESWNKCIAGNSGIGPITRFNPEKYPTQIAGEVKGFDPLKYFGPKDIKRYDLSIQYAVAASLDALKDASFEITPERADLVGIIIGSGIGGISTISDTVLALAHDGPRGVTPFFIPSAIINMASGYLAIRTGARGPNYSVVSACASSNHAIADGFHTILRGEAEVMIVGGTEAPITELGIAGFCAARALSHRNNEPTKASRPFDKDRDGFVLSEGAGMLILEEEDFARKRGAQIYARILSCGMSADAHHITAPPEHGEGAQLAMKRALKYAELRPEQIDYINAHGTSTHLGDIAETRAIKAVFNSHASKLAISANKSMIGHLLGGTGAVEAAFTILAMRHSFIPPTINLDTPDPECDLDYVPNTARRREIRYALSNSFGFGGTNATICFENTDR